MEDRYEIRGKIGQGGLGAVYRGYDLKMKREVAIKRILTSSEDPTIQEEATKQLAAEAGALASLQHPHIVTVYDVGQDEDGPYVVMELISGKTLDEIIESAPLTWPDFRELALQSQEALIAAQELNMIHSDLKPPNIMLTWLPSGKFQVKIVDFGLAMLAQNQNKDEIEELETVFGSIFFMPPEQFEREVLDVRSDLYSMGCVYYQCLTGKYPFTGQTGNEVMDAHLEHVVTPLQDVRAEIPEWVCDWVMWHINRDREDRPQTAREALAVFLQNDRIPNPKMSRGSAKGPKLLIPGAAAPTGDTSVITGVPLRPPGNTTSVQVMAAGHEEPEKTKSAPQPLAPPEGFKPSVHTSSMGTAAAAPTKPLTTPIGTGALTGPLATGPLTQPGTKPAIEAAEGVYISPVMQEQKTGMSSALKVMLAVVLSILVIIAGMMLINRSKQNQINERISALMAEASKEGVSHVPVSRSDLELLLKEASFTGVSEERDAIYSTLVKAATKDGTDIDGYIVNYVSEKQLLAEVRNTLIGEVLRDRADPKVVPMLMRYADSTPDLDSAVAAYRAIYNLVQDSDASQFLDIIISSKHPALKREAETNLGAIIDATDKPEYLTSQVIKAFDKTRDANAHNALIRMLGRCSTDSALEKIAAAIKSDDNNTKIAAIVALGNWKDMRGVDALIDYISNAGDQTTRTKAFDAVVKLASQPFVVEDDAAAQKAWTKIKDQAKTSGEKIKVINAIVLIDSTWPKPMVQGYTTDDNPQVAARAKKGLGYIADQEALKKKK